MTDFRLSPQQAFLLGRSVGVTECLVPLPEGVTAPELEARLDALVRRHEALRTTFVTPAGARAPVAQTVHDYLAPGFDVADAAAPDPERGPSIRVQLVDTPGGGRGLMLSALAACADRRSLALLGRALTARPEAADAEEPIQHADYAEWRHELATGDGPQDARGRSFWAQATQEAHPQTLLFGTRSGPASATASIHIGDAPGDDLFIDAAWHALLAKLAGSTELLTAELFDGRSQPELAGAIGPYAQICPIAISIGPETRFAELVDRLARARADARRWLDYALEADLHRVAECALAGFDATGGTTGCPVELRLNDGGLDLAYDPGVYDERDAEQLAHALQALLHAAAADRSQPVGALPLLDEGSRRAAYALGDGGDTAGGSDCVHHRFERQADATPELIAVAGGGVELTFRQLNERANRLAHHLTACGVSRDQPVGLCMRRSPGTVTALLAIMKAGGAYLPLNFAHPASRIAHQLTEAGARLVVTEESLLEQLPPLPPDAVVCLDRDSEAIAARPGDNPAAHSSGDDLAYVMYTSGSTGLPKGVAVTHRNLDSYTAAIVQRLDATSGTQFALVSEISTDLGNTAVFPPLITGGCLHVIDNETAMDGAALAAYCARHPLDVIKITPTQLRALLAAGDGFLPRRWLVIGGEALPWELAERVYASGSGCSVLNHYGPTETTVGCCTYQVRPGARDPHAATVPIGAPLPGARLYVLDSRLEPVPPGVAGELCVGGAGVARGYLNRPEETSDRFVPDPNGARMYRTGDRARFLRDGSIEFLGRLDHQLKIRGYRVEPGEVEAALLRHPQVREAAVVPHSNGDGDPWLVAYFAGAPEPALEELQAFLSQSLPDYMVPARWVPVSAFPLTPSGKIDRQALPDPEAAQSGRRGEYVAPRDELEREIATIWSQLLGVEEVGVLDDFFALGGHSLLATQAIMRIRRIYGNIPLGALFNSPTVAALAEVIRTRVGRDAQ